MLSALALFFAALSAALRWAFFLACVCLRSFSASSWRSNSAASSSQSSSSASRSSAEPVLVETASSAAPDLNRAGAAMSASASTRLSTVCLRFSSTLRRKRSRALVAGPSGMRCDPAVRTCGEGNGTARPRSAALSTAASFSACAGLRCRTVLGALAEVLATGVAASGWAAFCRRVPAALESDDAAAAPVSPLLRSFEDGLPVDSGDPSPISRSSVSIFLFSASLRDFSQRRRQFSSMTQYLSSTDSIQKEMVPWWYSQ
mmetsp:Transcript_87714/g.226045  ORF Transcript_87714/g.226045 Transcript_87714/m.226045 type:complete len:259 (-) Transcript_87714:426-1202(-)